MFFIYVNGKRLVQWFSFEWEGARFQMDRLSKTTGRNYEVVICL